MKSLRVKICGITELAAGQSIAQLGATDLGFICVPSSPRYIPSNQLPEIVRPLQKIVNCVGVFADCPVTEILETAIAANFGTIQLHGQETIEDCQYLRQQWKGEIIKAWRIKTPADLTQIAEYAPVVDTLLLDAYHPQALGGTGHTLDWPQLQDFQPSIPWLLAGGLRPENITTALSQLQPNGIDLSSGVEKSPGQKDLALVQQLFSNLRSFANGHQESPIMGTC
jgi:phosphoribosylanthranilate isomerase